MNQRDTHQDRVERMKLLYDLNKHITTLSTGTMLLMAGFYERVFKAPAWKGLAAASFLFFAATVLLSVFAMFFFAMYSKSTHKTDDDPVDAGATAFAIAIVLLILGVFCFTGFVIKNLH